MGLGASPLQKYAGQVLPSARQRELAQGAHIGHRLAVDEQRRRDDTAKHGERVLQAHEHDDDQAGPRVHLEERRRRAIQAIFAKRPRRLHKTRCDQHTGSALRLATRSVRMADFVAEESVEADA